MIDTHAHIDAKEFDGDRDAMLARAWDNGVTTIIIPAISPDRFDAVRSLAASDVRIFNGAGVHPHHAHEATDADLAHVELWCADPRTVAVGEIGIDYYYDFCPPDVQQRVFREQLRIAKRVGKPVIVHNRDADDDVLRIIDEEQDDSLRGVLHCFSSGVDIMHRAMDLGMHVSFTGNITFKKSTLDDVVRSVPEGRYMIETDSPYITPVPHRGKRNEPSHVRLVAEKLAEIRTMSFAEIIDSTTTTARRLFGLAMLIIIMSVAAIAQPTRPIDDDYETEDALDKAWVTYEMDSVAWAKFLKPRSLGVGLTIGFNTVVERQQFTQEFFRKTYAPDNKPNRWVLYGDSGFTKPISYDGLFAIGGSLMYSVTDAITVEGTYTFTRNKEPEKFGLDPVITHVFESAMLYNLNPYSKINFMLSGGLSMGIRDDGTTSDIKFGPNLGFAIGMSIPTSVGIIYPLIDVRFNFMIGVDKDRIVQRFDPVADDDPRYINDDGLIFDPSDPSRTSVHRADVTTLYSIPRITIMWYPAF